MRDGRARCQRRIVPSARQPTPLPTNAGASHRHHHCKALKVMRLHHTPLLAIFGLSQRPRAVRFRLRIDVHDLSDPLVRIHVRRHGVREVDQQPTM